MLRASRRFALGPVLTFVAGTTLVGGLARAQPDEAEAPAAEAEPAQPVVLPGDERIAGYLAELERQGRLPAETATIDTLKEAVVSAEDRLIANDATAATTRLFAVVESPRYAAFRDTPTFANAEYLLGRALLRGRAHRSAARYLERALTRGPQNPYYVPAHRAMVDLALETRAYAAVLDTLEKTAPSASGVPADAADERAYLRGRVVYERGDLPAADRELGAVTRRSRLYPSALYLRGLVAARRRDFASARKAFCSITDQKAKDRVAFNVDARFFKLRDLALLGLGRIAHEQDRYDEAYYFYFSIPEDSERLPEALFEASWSMLQKGEYRAARAFADQFDRLFPRSPLRPEVAILRANLAVRTCAFDQARVEADALVQSYAPIARATAAALADPARKRALLARLQSSEREAGGTSDVDGTVLALLKLDDRFRELTSMQADVDLDLVEASRAVRLWRELGARAKAGSAAQPVAASPEATQLVEDLRTLEDEARGGDPRVARRIARLRFEAELAAFPATDAGPYADEARASAAQVRRLSRLREELAGAIDSMAERALVELDERLRSVLGQVRLVHIDAVVGKKKRLEIEIARLNEGKLTPELFRKLAAEGALGDDEIYWPFEGEYWADEYENYR